MKNKENKKVPMFKVLVNDSKMPLSSDTLADEINNDMMYDKNTLIQSVSNDMDLSSYSLYGMNYTTQLLPKMINSISTGSLSPDLTTEIASTFNVVHNVTTSRISYLLTQASFYAESYFMSVLSKLPELYTLLYPDSKTPTRIVDLYYNKYSDISKQMISAFDIINSCIANDVFNSIPTAINVNTNDAFIVQNIVIANLSMLSAQITEMISALLTDTYPDMYEPIESMVSDAFKQHQLNLTNVICKFIAEFDSTNNGTAFVKNKEIIANSSVPYPVISDALITSYDLIKMLNKRIDKQDSSNL